MLVEKVSDYSGKTSSMELTITQEQVSVWLSGEPIQNVFPHLNADEREFLMTGITPVEWGEMFA